MMPNLDPRAMATAMKRLGIKQTEIPAKEIIIKTDENDIIIKNPTVSKIVMMGQESFQISGDISIQENAKENKFTDEDVKTVIEHTNCTKEDAESALKLTNCDIAEAILRLKP